MHARICILTYAYVRRGQKIHPEIFSVEEGRGILQKTSELVEFATLKISEGYDNDLEVLSQCMEKRNMQWEFVNRDDKFSTPRKNGELFRNGIKNASMGLKHSMQRQI